MTTASSDSSSSSFDLIVLGGGPGGYVAAIRAAQLGLKVACVDENPVFGGTCLRVGCIPSKALLESSHRWHALHGGEFDEHGIATGEVSFDLARMLARKDRIVDQLTKGIGFLFKKNKVTGVTARGRLVPGGVDATAADGAVTQLRAPHVIVATGSVPATIPGVAFDGDRIGSSTEALSYQEVPGTVAVIGGGVIGLELGSVWSRLGSEVTVLEYMPTLLSTLDKDIAKEALKLFKKQGLKFELGVKVTSAVVEGDKVRVAYARGEDSHELVVDRVLVATGRWPNSRDMGAEAVGLKLDARGFVEIDDHFRTNVPGVYAIGDVVRGPMLAHKAEEEGVACVELIAGQPGHVNYDAIPGVIYTHPEIASVGATQQQLDDQGVKYNVGKFPFAANARAKAMGETDGFVKILADAQTDRILGFHVIGPNASELIAEGAVAVEFKASAEDLARSVHAHPTISEVVKEAAMAAGSGAIHI